MSEIEYTEDKVSVTLVDEYGATMQEGIRRVRIKTEPSPFGVTMSLAQATKLGLALLAFGCGPENIQDIKCKVCGDTGLEYVEIAKEYGGPINRPCQCAKGQPWLVVWRVDHPPLFLHTMFQQFDRDELIRKLREMAGAL